MGEDISYGGTSRRNTKYTLETICTVVTSREPKNMDWYIQLSREGSKQRTASNNRDSIFGGTALFYNLIITPAVYIKDICHY